MSQHDWHGIDRGRPWWRRPFARASQRSGSQTPTPRWRSWLGIVWLIGLYGAVLFGMAFLAASMHPLVLPASRFPGPTMVYASDGKVLARLYEQYRVPVRIDSVPTYTIHAVLAAEDQRFFQHHGLDWRGILRAAWMNVRSGRVAQGGSTITQQLVRLDMLDDRRTIRRKLQEAVLALQVERGMTKREILERYLNAVYFGGGAYGIGAAAESYFRKPVAQLTPAESALLAGLIRAPGAGDPRYHRDIAQRRQREVLAAMHRLGWLSDDRYQAALQEQIVIRPRPRLSWQAPYAVEMVRQQLLEQYGRDLVYHGGLAVYTTIDATMQQAAERALAWAIQSGRGRGVSNGALVAIDPQTGEIRALVGGASFRASQFNRAVQAHRQPGSAFKVFIYLAAIQQGMSLSQRALDAPITIGNWSPANYGNQYFGMVTLETALARSLNSVAVRVAQRVGPTAVVQAARQAGITSPLQPTLPIALGAYEVTPLEMARAFATFANAGKVVEPGILREVRQGDTVIFRAQPVARQRLSPIDIYLLTQGLQKVITHGTGRRAAIGRPAAGKTGTSNNFRDAWFVGYTPDLAAAVWVGNDRQQPMRGVAGGSIPAPAWAMFMRAALQGRPPRDFSAPGGLLKVNLCTVSGNLATPYCPLTESRYVPAAHIPPECPLHTAPSVAPPAPVPDIFVEPDDDMPPDTPMQEPAPPAGGPTPPEEEAPEPASPDPRAPRVVPALPAGGPAPQKNATPPAEDAHPPADPPAPTPPEAHPEPPSSADEQHGEPGPEELLPAPSADDASDDTPPATAPQREAPLPPLDNEPGAPSITEERLNQGWGHHLLQWFYRLFGRR